MQVSYLEVFKKIYIKHCYQNLGVQRVGDFESEAINAREDDIDQCKANLNAREDDINNTDSVFKPMLHTRL